MIRFVVASLLVVLLLGLTMPSAARPEFLTNFQMDPLRRAEVDGCSTCHVNPRGGGPRNDFGTAYAAAGMVFTPMLRASFPDRFKFETVKLPNGTAFYFSDPESKSAIVEREQQKTVIDLATLTAAKTENPATPLPPPQTRMSFFVTSQGPGNGGHLGGLAGADRHCQALADAAGAGDRTWRAYLSTSFEDKPAVNAGDRIGGGPWFNAKGVLIGRGVSDLHSATRLTRDTALTEKGELISGAGSESNRHDILTGSLPNGTAAIGMSCNNWLSSGEGRAIVGHHDRQGTGDGGNSWNSAHTTNGCSQQTLRATGGDGLFYCFAIK